MHLGTASVGKYASTMLLVSSLNSSDYELEYS